MNDEFYQKFPSYNKNSKENRRHQKITVDYNEFLKTKKDNPVKNQKVKAPKSKIPVSKTCPDIDVFSVEERNKKALNDSKEKQIAYQKLLLQQIEDDQIKKKTQKEKERENERLLEERLQRQIESMNIETNDPWQRSNERIVERISLSENDKDRSPRRNNDVYRYFSKSSMSLFNYKDRYFYDLDLAIRDGQEEKLVANCTQCHKKVEILCNECQNHNKHLHDALNIDYRTNNRPLKMLTHRENFAPYTFDNSTRLQKNTLNDLEKYNYSKIYKEFKKRKDVKQNTKRNDVGIDKKVGDINVEELLGDGQHQQYTVITGYAKSLLEKC